MSPPPDDLKIITHGAVRCAGATEQDAANRMVTRSLPVGGSRGPASLVECSGRTGYGAFCYAPVYPEIHGLGNVALSPLLSEPVVRVGAVGTVVTGCRRRAPSPQGRLWRSPCTTTSSSVPAAPAACSPRG